MDDKTGTSAEGAATTNVTKLATVTKFEQKADARPNRKPAVKAKRAVPAALRPSAAKSVKRRIATNDKKLKNALAKLCEVSLISQCKEKAMTRGLCGNHYVKGRREQMFSKPFDKAKDRNYSDQQLTVIATDLRSVEKMPRGRLGPLPYVRPEKRAALEKAAKAKKKAKAAKQ